MKKKIILSILCIGLAAVVSVMGTLAYLTDRDSVANTFTVGRVDIDLDEADVDADGQPVLNNQGEPVDRVKENEYHLIPGRTYLKDPTITVKAGSEASYIRMILIVHNTSAVQAIIDKYGLGNFASLIGGWNQDIWLYEGFKQDTVENTISFEFRYQEIVEARTEAKDLVLPPLFETLIVPGEVNGEEMQALYDGGFKIVVNGHGIQAVTFADDDEAWTAFDRQVSLPANP